MHAHKFKSRVIYGDTDNMGFAYHANYLRWFEMGRTEMFRALGLPYKTIEEKGIFLPVSEAYCKYWSPAKYDDTIVIETRYDQKFKGGIKFDYLIWDAKEKTKLAGGFTKHACVDPNGRVVRPPDFLKSVIKTQSDSN